MTPIFSNTDLESVMRAQAEIRSRMIMDKDGLLAKLGGVITKIRTELDSPTQTMSQMVKEFHEKQGILTSSDGPKVDEIQQRFLVMLEEWDEVSHALHNLLIGGCKEDLAHELADLIYTIVGTALVFGIEIEPVFTEVHRCNMLKGPGFDKTNYEKPEINV